VAVSVGWLAQPTVLPWVAFVFGLCVGSFLNVVIHRLPKMLEREWLAQVPEVLEEAHDLKGKPDVGRVAGEVRTLTKDALSPSLTLVTPRSRCPHCGHQISALENVPLLSFAFLRGRCVNCHVRIGWRYPLVEALTGLGTLYCAYRFGFSSQALAAAIFLWFTLALAFIDQDTGFLPDDLTLPLVWIGLLFNVGGTFAPLHEAVMGAVAGYMVLWTITAAYKLLRGVQGMGHGDFKMTAAVGAFLGWKALFMVILISACVGLIFGLIQMISARGGWDSKFKFHFGPYIAIAGLVAMFWGPTLVQRFPTLRPFA
jgi:leader peptidase (prepilin peptidase) / N-methyltransferase